MLYNQINSYYFILLLFKQVINDALYVYIQAHAHTWQGHECDNIANFMKLKFSPQKK